MLVLKDCCYHVMKASEFGERLRGNAIGGQQDGESPRGKSSSERVSERASESLREVRR